jgi:hypothetical protein
VRCGISYSYEARGASHANWLRRSGHGSATGDLRNRLTGSILVSRARVSAAQSLYFAFVLDRVDDMWTIDAAGNGLERLAMTRPPEDDDSLEAMNEMFNVLAAHAKP